MVVSIALVLLVFVFVMFVLILVAFIVVILGVDTKFWEFCFQPIVLIPHCFRNLVMIQRLLT